jgi:drug/metabolite transporter (DMT)-like permease
MLMISTSKTRREMMPPEVMIAVVLGSLLHASWNALVRGAPDRTLDMVLIVGGAGVITACWLPFAPVPAVQSWPYLAASVVIHVAYFLLVALSYRKGELSFAYPIMRGTAPAVSALAAALLLSESPSPGGWLGVLLICFGVILLARDSWRSKSFQTSSAVFALINAAVIVLYTLVDGVGARLSGHSTSYTSWMFLLTALSLLAIFVPRDGSNVLRYIRHHWPRGLVGGACTLGAYGLALWGMTRAPIALVAALRETSVLFAVIIAGVLLRERITRTRYVSIFIVLAGAVAIKVS